MREIAVTVLLVLLVLLSGCSDRPRDVYDDLQDAAESNIETRFAGKGRLIYERALAYQSADGHPAVCGHFQVEGPDGRAPGYSFVMTNLAFMMSDDWEAFRDETWDVFCGQDVRIVEMG